jgi:GNAT superfamily N-acetyltransferase
MNSDFMRYDITNTTVEDLNVMYRLFDEAIAFLKTHNYIGWTNYDKVFIKADVEKGLSYKITRDSAVACIFSVCYEDPLIWREMEKGDALYLHRIVLNRDFSGEKLFAKVLEWALEHAKNWGIKYVRMDTWADNARIIDYYKSYGFRFIENYTTGDTTDLPVQHRNLNVALLELSM